MRTNLHHLLEEAAGARPDAPALTFKTRARQTRFSHGSFNQYIAHCFNIACNRFKKVCTHSW